MSWAEVKKAINSDLGTPLNARIENKGNEVLNKGNEIINKINQTASPIRSIQKGVASNFSDYYQIVTISPVDINKTLVILNGSQNASVYLNSSSSTAIGVATHSSYKVGTFSYQVIEFY